VEFNNTTVYVNKEWHNTLHINRNTHTHAHKQGDHFQRDKFPTYRRSSNMW